MNSRSTSTADRLARLALMLLLTRLPSSVCLGQTDPSGTDWSVVDTGPYYQVLQRTVSVTNNSTGEISPQGHRQIPIFSTSLGVIAQGQMGQLQTPDQIPELQAILTFKNLI